MKKILLAVVTLSALVSVLFWMCIVSIAFHQIPESSQVIQDSKPKPITVVSSETVEAKINEWRAANGLPVFNTQVPALDIAAQVRADDMCATNDWSHAKDWAILDQYYAYTLAGENLYYGGLQENQANDAVVTWANSPSHLENLMKGYTQIGIGVKSCPMFQGRSNVVIITNYFGVPR